MRYTGPTHPINTGKGHFSINIYRYILFWDKLFATDLELLATHLH